MIRRTVLAALVALAALLALAGSWSAPPAELTVLAASSLTESLTRVAALWTAKGHGEVHLSFEASSKLARQIEAGAPADAFFSADEVWMDELTARGLLDPATRVDLLGNTLVVVLPAISTIPVRSAADLQGAELRRLALAGESVPAGRYGRAALQGLGVWDALSPRVVSGDNVRTVLSWVATAEADGGVVYATDARVEPRVKVAFTFPSDSHPPIVYPAAVVRASAQAEEAGVFISWCRSAEAGAVFEAAGFTTIP